MPDPIAFYFDFSSPYGYLATFRVEEVAARHGRTVDWHPFLLGIVMQKTGATPLVNQPIRGPYFRHDLERMARDYSAPFVWPQNFPFHSVAASRAFYWVKDRDPELAVRLARKIYHAYWGEGRDVAKPQQVADEVCANLALDADELLAALASDEVKDRLRAEVDEVIARGIFGSPMFDIDGELFWGCDKFAEIDRWMTEGGW
jgi:2-hydroxychromene-2-carboxylate isomerase